MTYTREAGAFSITRPAITALTGRCLSCVVTGGFVCVSRFAEISAERNQPKAQIYS